VWSTAERIYTELRARGVETILDDRDERPGVKFKDADLLGIPLRVTVGPKALARGNVELKERRAAKADEVGVADASGRIVGLVEAALRS
jgi:prolyl-tRNA synthetase